MWSISKILSYARLQKKDGIFYSKLKTLIGFTPQNLQLYSEAFTHPSYQHHRHKRKSYERLEFLGDAVLGSVVAEHLFLQAPEQNEGYLTKMRSKIVERRNLNELGEELNLCDFLRSRLSMQQLGNNINGNLFEALIGAIYLDKGYDVCKKFIHQKLIERYGDLKKLERKIISYKSLLIEWCQKNKRKFKFETVEDTNDRSQELYFTSKLSIEGYATIRARATSKKKAEEKAAKRIYFKLQGKK